MQRRIEFIWYLKVFLLMMLTCFLSGKAAFAAEELTVGVATNFMVPFKEFIRIFEQKTDIRVYGTYASTGNLYGQIKNGAPYDLFLSADRARPDRLYEDGLTEEVFVYAQGRVVLWTQKKDLCGNGSWDEVLMAARVKKISIANPETAPYGAAAVIALKGTGLWNQIRPRLVYAQTVTQAFQYAHTEAVDAGFCAFSSAHTTLGKKGCHYRIEEAPPIIQTACILKRTKMKVRAEAFAAFLTSPEARVVKKRYGYE